MTRYLLSCFFLFTNVSIKSQNVNECIIEKGLQYISVKTFGAVGDGIANDRFAIQKAFNSGKNIYFPNGIYSLKDKTNAEAFILIEG